jgi:hypothetical protein
METAHKVRHGNHAHRSKRHSNGRTINRILGHLPSTESIGTMAASAADGITEQMSELKEIGVQTAEAVERRIVRHPKSSVLLALALGYAWGRLRKYL